MLLRRVLMRMSSTPTPYVPPAPKLLSGEVEAFRYDAESQHLFDGYNLDELYGVKIGIKHSPAMEAEMKKDNITCLLLFILGLGIISKINSFERQEVKELQELVAKKQSRKVTLPDTATSPIRNILWNYKEKS